MPNLTYTSSAVYNQFFGPFLKLTRKLDRWRKCPVLSDLNWLLFGVLRVLHQVASGREFLQILASQLDQGLERSHFFETLKSKRRAARKLAISSVFSDAADGSGKTCLGNRQQLPFRKSFVDSA